ncbi:hypothetical protein DIZ27_41830 [Streptomyces sp. NWU339]|uniref:hypothetical protein n=1 Tax=Streptomyces sp. NWU339 TaxID=2185284 RepID=UPI000D680878|nr:hypothetical protein [Streptomyces sp. NWU339]PWI05015.1 hypothetical protein DIZ27_41830 [Streptomyces sp. NWU339]
MSSATIQFVGGPADGRLLAIPGDPPHVYDQMATPSGHRPVYRREANPGDDGPLWHYRYDQQESEGTVGPEERHT